LKGFHLGILAFVKSGLSDAQYWIVGDGPERSRLERLAKHLGVTDRVRFFGQLPRTAALELLGQCHALIHPSLHDSGGWACIEAMAAGRPVICLDLGGPGTQVTEETGFKVAAQKPDQAVAELAEIIRQLGTSNELWLQLGNYARQQVQQNCCWRSKVKVMSKLYRAR
jgi:glycosyltransferase involved in cell wall biosynthesis